jgi:hypothetical protein
VIKIGNTSRTVELEAHKVIAARPLRPAHPAHPRRKRSIGPHPPGRHHRHAGCLAHWPPQELHQLAMLLHRMVNDFLAYAAEEDREQPP